MKCGKLQDQADRYMHHRDTPSETMWLPNATVLAQKGTNVAVVEASRSLLDLVVEKNRPPG